MKPMRCCSKASWHRPPQNFVICRWTGSVHFSLADIGFHPYPQEKLKAFSQQLAEQGIYERIIVRPIPESEDYEILAGIIRTEAWRLTEHATIPAES